MEKKFAYLLSIDVEDRACGWCKNDIVQIIEHDAQDRMVLVKKKINNVDCERWFYTDQIMETSVVDIIKDQLDFYATSAIITNSELAAVIANEVKKLIF